MTIHQILKMGRHNEWRKIAKRERRRRIRKVLAKEKGQSERSSESHHDGTLHQASPEYQTWLKEQAALDLFEHQQIEKTNLEEHEKWMKSEEIAMQQWKRLLEKKNKIREKRLEQEAKLKIEWELEQEKKKREVEKLKEIEEENNRKQEIFMAHLEQFLNGDSSEPPPELLISRQTRPTTAPCPFFSKTACCRFGDQCSRNHKYPGISKVLLATNFYTHFGLDNASFSEYDTDVMLEYEDNDTYKDFKEFFYDVLPEFEKFGRIVQFKVCNNFEKHLRGNTYVEFAELRCAVAAYRSLHSRWYGGKQITLQFCTIISWKNAICGLQSRKRCPKGRACNFLHIFRNPNNLFYNHFQESERPRRTPPRSWRWSESPEVEITKRRRLKSSMKSRSSSTYSDSNRRSERSSRRSSTKKTSRRSPA